MTAAMHVNIVSLLNSVQDEETALMRAARRGSVGIVTKLIQHGANVNLTNKVTSCTPCLVCVTSGMYTLDCTLSLMIRMYIHSKVTGPQIMVGSLSN